MDISGNLKAALMRYVKARGSMDVKAAAKAGFVDQTKEDAVGDKGRNATGPVGRKRWYAVVFGF